MAQLFKKVSIKALKELGWSQVSLYGAYRFGIFSGWLRRRTQASLHTALATPAGKPAFNLLNNFELQMLQSTILPEGRSALIERCDEICKGRMRIFQNLDVPIIEQAFSNELDWSQVLGNDPNDDIKFKWEPARFGWAFHLVQAFALTGEDRYRMSFWDLSDAFFETNPPYRGLQWASGQEVAIRLMALVYAGHGFSSLNALGPEECKKLSMWIAVHAARIPPTMIYARAQNNNHLLAEAAGLLTAGLALPNHPQARAWRDRGWAWLQQGVLLQIDLDGAYIQHSTNYHRLMLQLIVWATLLGAPHGFQWDKPALRRIQSSVGWLNALVDAKTGKAPNLGPNDGAYILPLTQCPFEDYRPVLQAAANIFYNKSLYPPGLWDDLSLWLGISARTSAPAEKPAEIHKHPLTLQHSRLDTWCYLRAARFKGRPGHADQLHLDVWYRGQNIALDAGTYRYNATPPWDNVLTHSAVHNTLTIHHQEQMSRSGRFLYLDWAQAEVLEKNSKSIAAWHNGYGKFGVKHQRSVSSLDFGWLVVDSILPIKNTLPSTPTPVSLHWLLPDWDWHLHTKGDIVLLILKSPLGEIEVQIHCSVQGQKDPPELLPYLVRAGQTLHGEMEAQPTWGWVSPNYGVKKPALALNVRLEANLPIELVTEWRLPS